MAYFDVVMTWRTRVEAKDEEQAKEHACYVLDEEMAEMTFPLLGVRYEVTEVQS